ncbi:hypothetical protein BLOT_002544 [Blomia tropicalis]|nr:hypothetical protein BLOT_002544 [Blomia tropicalis]
MSEGTEQKMNGQGDSEDDETQLGNGYGFTSAFLKIVCHYRMECMDRIGVIVDAHQLQHKCFK